MKIVEKAIDEIRPYEQNPRQNDQAVDAVAASLKEFGFRQPIVVDEAGVIIVGHTRWKAAKKLGLKTVPVHVAADLPPEKAKAYRLADNKTNELVEWNDVLLAKEISALTQDMTLFGFSEDELASLSNVVDAELEVRSHKVLPLPELGWILVGVPIARFGEVTTLAEACRDIEGSIIQTSVSGAIKHEDQG